ncbi:MAG: 2-succinyl-5-enolpyruvyl-6-hydroxy-3-cyclohexene-1-carboxylic-acid synthase [Acidimicrobiales bacterium]
MPIPPEDLQATYCVTLVDEWVRDGVEHAVICPGSRSTPLALALVADGRLRVHVHHDERSGGFMALGLAAATGEAVVVLTTSGTAAVELHPAVVEADLARVPLLVCTADRPPELIGVGAAQAIDQTHLYGRSVRWFHAPGVAEESASPRWRAVASRAHAEATGTVPGPVHLNLAFREPLVGEAGALPSGRSTEGAWAWRPSTGSPVDPEISLVDDLAGRRGILVAGARSGPAAALTRVAAALGWPVLAAPQAPVWGGPGVIGAPDAILRNDIHLRPEVIVHLGGPLASRVAGEWLAATGAAEIVVDGERSWTDPHGTAAFVLPMAPEMLVDRWLADVDGVSPVDDGAWLARWSTLGGQALAAIDATLAAEPHLTEPAVARALVAALPAGGALVVSSSMPIRDLEWYVEPGVDVEVHANRGANGIDGVVSTAVGVALADPGRPAALLIGDVAFLHDTNGLLGAAERGVDLVIVVVDNDGGGIFSFLPQAQVVGEARFEQLYGTPHGLDLVAVASAHGAHARAVSDVGPAVAEALAAGGVHVLVVHTDRAANVEVHARLNAAVAEAVRASDQGR